MVKAGEGTSQADVAGDAPPSKGRAFVRTWRPLVTRLLEPLSAMALSSVMFVVGFGGGIGRLSQPLGGGDVLAAYGVGNMWASGAPFGNAALGYPFGTELRYFPTADVLQNAFSGLFVALTGNTFFGTNLLFAVSFPITTLAALWVLRIAGLRGPMAIFAALAFTAIPFHWMRAEHMYLATMYSAVLGIGLALLVGTGEVARRLTSRGRLRTCLPLLGIVVVIALSGIYYACFTILLCAVAVVFRVARGSSWRHIVASAAPMLGVSLFLALALAPAILFVHSHPALKPVAGRLVVESVIYSGNLALALFPSPVSQLPGFGPVNESVRGFFAAGQFAPTSGVTIWSNSGSFFTVVAILFAGVGLVLSSRRAIRARAAGSAGARSTTTEQPAVGFGLVGTLLITVVLFYVPWGLNVVFAYEVSPQLRAWDRLTPVFFMLVFVAAAVAWQSLGLRPRATWVWPLVAVLLVLLSLDAVVPYRGYFAEIVATSQERHTTGSEYAAKLNAAVPGHCGVLALPYIAFPESEPVVQMGDHEPYWPVLTNTEKEWSFGAMKNTAASAWQVDLGNRIDARAIGDLEAGGFCAVHVDRRGYSPADGDRVVAELTALLGAPVATGDAGRWLAFGLPTHAKEGSITLESIASAPDQLQTFYVPPAIEPTGATGLPETDAFDEWWWIGDAPVTFDVRSIRDYADFATVSAELQAADCAPRDVVVSLTSGDQVASTTISLAAGETRPVSLHLDRLTTDAVLSVTAKGPACSAPKDSRMLSVAVKNPVAE